MFFDKMSSLVSPVFLAIVTCFLSSIAPAQEPAPIRWKIEEQNRTWAAHDVAIGDHGTTLIAARLFDDPRVDIYSTISDQQIGSLQLQAPRQLRVAAAAKAQTLALASVRSSGQGSGRVFHPEIFGWADNLGGPPSWSYRFDDATSVQDDGFDLAISDDGEIVVAWISRFRPHGEVATVVCLDRFGNVLLEADLQHIAWRPSIAGGTISRNGKRLLIDIAGIPHLFELESGDLLETWPFHIRRSGLAISDDGSCVAIGFLGRFAVYRENPSGAFEETKSIHLTNDRHVTAIALDQHGDHAAFSIVRLSELGPSQVRFRDLRQDRELFRRDFGEPSTYGLLEPAQLCLAEDASVVAGAWYGNQQGGAATAFAFARSGQPLSLFADLRPASAFDMDRSGQVAALATTRGAASNEPSGTLLCADMRQPELSLHGFPQSNGKLVLAVRGEASHARAVAALELGESRTAWGPSQLDLSTVIANSGFQSIPSSGLQRKVTLPDTPALRGRVLHFQAELIDQVHQSGYLSNRVSIRVLP